MNKLNIKQDLSESTIPLYDKSEMSYTFQKETKKLTRLPFYKLEELKKQEEKKAKHRNKLNKKEDILIPHVQLLDKNDKPVKKKRIILKKIKEENPKITSEELEAKNDYKNTQIGSTDDNKAESINKITKTKIQDKQMNKPPNHSGNTLQMLKYSTDEIIQKKIKLSRKQRKLQEAENTLASFLSKEEKNTFYNNNSSYNYNASIKFPSNEGEFSNNINDKVYTSSLNLSSMNVNNINNPNNSSNNMNNLSTANINNVTIKKTDNNVNLTILGKKKKRINKFKKAVYKYRFKKKQFIFNNVFKIENNCKDKTNYEPTENNSNQKSENNLITIPPVEDLKKGMENFEGTAEKGANDKIQININKPNFIEKSNFYSQDKKNIQDINTNMYNINSLNNQNNIVNANNQGYYNANNYNYYQNNYYPYNYQYNYLQYFYPCHPFNLYNNQQYYYDNQYYYTTTPQFSNNYANSNYLNKFNLPFNHKQNTVLKNDLNKIKPFEKNSKNNQQQEKKSKKKKKKKKNKNKNIMNKFELIDQNQMENLNKTEKKGFLFESVEKEQKEIGLNSEISANKIDLIKNPEEFKSYLKSTYHIEKDISNLNGIELNNYLKEHTFLKKVDIKSLKKIADDKTIETYIKNFEGILPEVNTNKRIIREYVDQILDYELDKKFGDFIVKMRDLYYKKKQINPLKAKRRFVVGMREIEKYIRLDEVKCLFVTPNIEKVEGEHSLDDRLYKIFKDCEIKKIPKIFGMNKFKLGKLARKKYSCVSMLAFVNVEGFEREFRDLLEYAEKFRNKFYENFRNIKDSFKDNIFINMELFDIQEKPNNSN